MVNTAQAQITWTKLLRNSLLQAFQEIPNPSKDPLKSPNQAMEDARLPNGEDVLLSELAWILYLL